METTSPEAVPVHSKESPPGHSRVPNAEKVKKETNAPFSVQITSIKNTKAA